MRYDYLPAEYRQLVRRNVRKEWGIRRMRKIKEKIAEKNGHLPYLFMFDETEEGYSFWGKVNKAEFVYELPPLYWKTENPNMLE